MKYPQIDPVALSLGPLQIRWYALAYLAGFLLGWKYALYLCGLDEKKEPRGDYIEKETIDDFIPWAILGVILGGRIGYVLFYQLDLYLDDPLEMFKVWHGGMSFHGGALGAITAMVGYAFYKKIKLLRLTDLFCCAAPIGLFFGRLANFVNGELFGRASDVPWAMVFPRGGDFARHPSQLYEAGLEGFVLFGLLAFLVHKEKIRNTPGILTGVLLAGYGCARIFVECFREPDVQIGYIEGVLTMGQILSMPMIIGGLALIFYARRAQKAHA